MLFFTSGEFIDDVVKSLDELRRDNDMALGEASPKSLADGRIIANKNSRFLKRWFQQYQNLDDALWASNHSRFVAVFFRKELKSCP